MPGCFRKTGLQFSAEGLGSLIVVPQDWEPFGDFSRKVPYYCTISSLRLGTPVLKPPWFADALLFGTSIFGMAGGIKRVVTSSMSKIPTSTSLGCSALSKLLTSLLHPVWDASLSSSHLLAPSRLTTKQAAIPWLLGCFGAFKRYA